MHERMHCILGRAQWRHGRSRGETKYRVHMCIESMQYYVMMSSFELMYYLSPNMDAREQYDSISRVHVEQEIQSCSGVSD